MNKVIHSLFPTDTAPNHSHYEDYVFSNSFQNIIVNGKAYRSALGKYLAYGYRVELP